MKIAMFYHSILSDWNHGNAHFLRGIASELISRGCDVQLYEPKDAWSCVNLRAEHGEKPVEDFHRVYPSLHSQRYEEESLDCNSILDDVDLAIVHEWNTHGLVRKLGEARARNSRPRLLFHDTHHRAVTAPEQMEAYDLYNYDGVLAYGRVLSDIYLERGWAARAWTWHEAADTAVFHPRTPETEIRDLVWIGNWGDGERTRELHEFLIEPARELGLDADVYGVRYPEDAKNALAHAGLRYNGWLPNFRVPAVFASARATVHIPRGPYVERLPGIPTIRPFEALACGIPLVSAPWRDVEGLFTPGKDYLVARDGQEMKAHLQDLLDDPDRAAAIAAHGLQTIQSRHTCRHRVDELLAIYASIKPANSTPHPLAHDSSVDSTRPVPA